MSADPICFVGSYGPADEACIFAVSVVSGSRLELVGEWSGIVNPSFVALTPGGDRLIAVSETGLGADGRAGEVCSFAIDDGPDGVLLTPLGARSSEGDHPCHVDVHPGGRWVVVSNYGSGDIAILPLDADGALGDASCTVRHEGSGPISSRQAGPHAHSAVFTPDGGRLISANLGSDRVVVSDFDEATGELTAHLDAPVTAGSGPRHIAIVDDGRHVLVANELSNTVTWYELDDDRSMTARQTITTLPPDAPENLVAEIAFDAAGRRVLVSNRGHDSIAMFSFDTTAGLEHTTTFPSGGAWPRHFSVLPGGDGLIVANEHDDRLVLLRADGQVSDTLALTAPTCITPKP